MVQHACYRRNHYGFLPGSMSQWLTGWDQGGTENTDRCVHRGAKREWNLPV